MYICEHFHLTELVSPVVYKKYGSFAWNFFDDRMLRDLDLLRDLWGKPLVVNNWKNGGGYKQSGLRCNIDPIVYGKKEPYLSAHVLGRGFDVKPLKLADTSDLLLCVLENYKKFETLSRIEDYNKTGTWIHVDNMVSRGNNITVF